MVNSILVAAAVNSIADILKAKDIPYEIEDSAAYKSYMKVWDRSSKKDLAYRQARPAMERILSREYFAFVKGGVPMRIRLNDPSRKMEDSFAEILLERTDLNWHIAISVKLNANIIATLPFAGREQDMFEDHVVGAVNEIDDFGDRIFGVPCSNEYFDDMNEILLKIAPYDKESWRAFLKEETLIYDTLLSPILRALGSEIKKICEDHPEAPARMFDFFYGKYDYYYINPIEQVKVTKIGALNAHGDLGRLPDNDNHTTAYIKYPTKLLDVRFANGKYGQLSKDTLQFTFDGGWALCFKVMPGKDRTKGRTFELNVYVPVTPFGSYRDQVDWDPEA